MRARATGVAYVARVDTSSPVLDHARFSEALRAVQAYVRSEPGAHAALMEAARRDPDGVTGSLVALGAVLLDIASGAFRLTPDEMLEKVASHVSEGSSLPVG